MSSILRARRALRRVAAPALLGLGAASAFLALCGTSPTWAAWGRMGSDPAPHCGNGLLEPWLDETCDDGNRIGGDGCNALCHLEHCGNGVLEPELGEECDDGNQVDGDGCSMTCELEAVNRPPVARCRDVKVECAVPPVRVSVDAGSFDPDGDPITLVQSPPGPYGAGTTRVTLTVTDIHGVSDTCTADVTVKPDAPPVVEVADPIELWPPNHAYEEISLSECIDSIRDECDGDLDPARAARILSIYSDEPEDATGRGDGATLDDIVILDDQTFKVRAERQGAGNGRVYGVEFKVADPSGGVAFGTCFVTVPHDQSGAPAVDDGPDAGYVVVAGPG